MDFTVKDADKFFGDVGAKCPIGGSQDHIWKHVISCKPGTKEFRAALRDSLEGIKNLPASHGIFNMSPTNHQGLDQRAQVMVKIEKGAWKYVP